MQDKWDQLADKETVEKTVASLQKNGCIVFVVDTGQQAKEKALELLPQGAEVMTMTSMTLDAIGLTKEINESGNYNAVKPKLFKMFKMDRATQGKEIQQIGAAPDWAIGSVHAVTEEGQVLIASNTGSQLSAYTYGASHVIWVIGTQKIVKNVDEGMKRLYEHSLPLEAQRARKAYGVAGSNVGKILIVNKEVKPGRITVLLVNEVLGF